MTQAPTPAPPGRRGRLALQMTAAAAEGKLAIQVCSDCGAAQYPPREVCHRCLSSDLQWKTMNSAKGRLLATTRLHHSNEEYFKPLLPLVIGLVQLELGPTVVAFVSGGCAADVEVDVSAELDASGQAVLMTTAVGTRSK